MKRLTLACKLIEESHTARHLEQMIQDILDKYCPKKTVAIIHDNASNMVAMKLPFQAYRCVAHTLQLSIKKALVPVDDVVKRARNLVLLKL